MANAANIHLGIIPDGTRRWGRLHDKPKSWDGMEAGSKVEEILWHVSSHHPEITEITIWAMSTENFDRGDGDRRRVFRLVERLLGKEESFRRAGARVRFVSSRLHLLPESLKVSIDRITEFTKRFNGLQLNIGLGYGGREEILRAASQAARKPNLADEHVKMTTAAFESHLMLRRPLDMVLRTGGEQRLSGFMLYQIEYAELFFTRTLWPDFSTVEFDAMVNEYRDRDRRFGR